MTKDEALRLALEALENHIEDPRTSNLIEKLIAAIKEALAQQEPQIAFNAEVIGYVAPQRTWVGLSDAEIIEAWHWGGTDPHIEGDHFTVLYKYFEAKLKDKNHV